MTRKRNVDRTPLPPMTSLELAALRQACKELRVRGKAGEETLTGDELLMAKAQETALKGGSHALRLLSDLYKDAQEKHAALREEQCEIWTLIRNYHQHRIDRARASGYPEELILPHPDDIETSPEFGVRVHGPVNEEELQQTRHQCRVRDAFIAQDAIDRRAEKRRHDATILYGDLMLQAIVLDNGIARRFRRGSDAMIDLRMRLT